MLKCGDAGCKAKQRLSGGAGFGAGGKSAGWTDQTEWGLALLRRSVISRTPAALLISAGSRFVLRNTEPAIPTAEPAGMGQVGSSDWANKKCNLL
jgi:hypothetical protein